MWVITVWRSIFILPLILFPIMGDEIRSWFWFGGLGATACFIGCICSDIDEHYFYGGLMVAYGVESHFLW